MDDKRVDAMKVELPSDEVVYDVATLFKMFGDATRMKILCCLKEKEMHVGEIAGVLNMSVSAVSHQLRVLRTTKLVKGVKEGKEVRYSLDDDHVTKIMEYGFVHVEHSHH